MALEDEVKARFSTQHIANLTNPDNPGSGVIDAGRLSNAVTDVEAMFSIYCGVVYDNSVATHVATAVAAVQEMLRVYTGQVSADEARERAVRWLRDLARVTGRDRILPQTTSTLQPSPETGPSGTPPKPYFDTPYFNNLEPDVPGTTSPYVSP